MVGPLEFEPTRSLCTRPLELIKRLTRRGPRCPKRLRYSFKRLVPELHL